MKSTLSLAAAVGLLVVSSANAGFVVLDNTGWQAVWDSSLDPYVQIHYNGVVGNSILIQKSAEFTQGPNRYGVFPSIPIQFQQIGPSTINEIVILDESIRNSTGVDWTDFHFDLLDGTDAYFDEYQDFFFTTAPLNNQQFVNNHQGFYVDGFGLGPDGTDAVVPAGSPWFPGDGASDGDLVISVVSKSAEPYTVFTLKETPTPEPASLVLLALGALMLRRR